MHNNLHYFDYSKNCPERLFDSYYAKNHVVVIPDPKGAKNELVLQNKRLIDLITDFDSEIKSGKTQLDTNAIEIVQEIARILDNTKNINYSAFCQFFMVYNMTFSHYKKMEDQQKMDFLYQILVLYCNERHSIYTEYGYTNSILQTLCDNYSHKRNSKASIKKFIDMLQPYGLHLIKNPEDIITDDDYYFLPDKTGKACFDAMLTTLNLEMKSRDIEQAKRPDVVFKHSGHYYIFELKMMKGGGGGQNKQAVEFAYFIKFSEDNPNVHYCVMLDSLYANELFNSQQPKIAAQRNDVLAALQDNPNNYFVNTAGAELLLQDIFRKNKNVDSEERKCRSNL